MFIDKITSNSLPPPGVGMTISFLSLGKETDTSVVVKHIKSVKKASRRLYCLLYVHEYQELTIIQKREIFKPFIDEEFESLKYHMVLFSGLYHITENISKLQDLGMNHPNELVRCAAIWSRAKLGDHKDLFERIKVESPNVEEDESISLLAASLYLINNNKNSQEMLFLKDYFLDNFYDEGKKQFYDLILHNVDFSSELIAYLLWQIGYKYKTIDDWRSLDLDWLILNG